MTASLLRPKLVHFAPRETQTIQLRTEVEVQWLGPGTSLAYWVNDARSANGGEFLLRKVEGFDNDRVNEALANTPLDLLSEVWGDLPQPDDLPAHRGFALTIERLPGDGSRAARTVYSLRIVITGRTWGS